MNPRVNSLKLSLRSHKGHSHYTPKIIFTDLKSNLNKSDVNVTPCNNHVSPLYNSEVCIATISYTNILRSYCHTITPYSSCYLFINQIVSTAKVNENTQGTLFTISVTPIRNPLILFRAWTEMSQASSCSWSISSILDLLALLLPQL